MRAAGSYDHRATFFRVTVEQDAAGIEVAAPAELCKAMANVRYGGSAERRTAAGTEASQAFTVQVRGTAKLRTVKVTDRVTAKHPKTGHTFAGAITGIAPVAGGDIEFTAVAALGAGA